MSFSADEDYFEVRHPDTEAYIGFDVRFFPCYITHWSGAPTEALMDEFFKARSLLFERGRKEGRRLVQITDMTRFETPPATVRKYMGHVGPTQDHEYGDVFMGYVIVIPSAMVRGVITALRWLAGEEVKPTEYVPSIEAAFKADWTKSIGVDIRGVPYKPR